MLQKEEMNPETIRGQYNQKLICQNPSFIILVTKTAHLYWISRLSFFLNKKNNISMSHHNHYGFGGTFCFDSTYTFKEKTFKITL